MAVENDGEPPVRVLTDNPLTNVNEVISRQLIEVGPEYSVSPIVLQSDYENVVVLPVRQIRETGGHLVELRREVTFSPLFFGEKLYSFLIK